MKIVGLAATVAALVAVGSAGSAMAMPPLPPGLYVQVYGGATPASPVNWGSATADSLNGVGLGGSLGMAIGDTGVLVEADFFHTSRGDADTPAYLYTTTSVMLDGKYAFHLNDMFQVYGGAGLGLINVAWDDGYNYNGTGIGYQLMAGASVKIADNASFFGEVRHQDTFGQVIYFGSDTLQQPTNSLLFGIKIAAP